MPLSVSINVYDAHVDATNVTSVSVAGLTDQPTNTVAVTFTDSTGAHVGPSAATVLPGGWSIAANISSLADGPVAVTAVATDGVDHVSASVAITLDANISHGYTTVANLRAVIGDASTLETTNLQTHIQTASRWVDSICERRFYVDTVASARVYTPDDLFCVDIDDVANANTIVLKTETGFAAPYTYSQAWTLNTDFIAEPVNSVVAGIPGWPVTSLRAVNTLWFPKYSGFYMQNPNTVQVTANWGWAAVPDDVAMATTLIAKDLYLRGKSNNGYIGVDGWGPAKVREDPAIMALLGPFLRNAVSVG